MTLIWNPARATPDDFVEVVRASDPEREGELAKLTKGTVTSLEWIGGFLLNVMIAPDKIAPNQWPPKVIDGAMAGLDQWL